MTISEAQNKVPFLHVLILCVIKVNHCIYGTNMSGWYTIYIYKYIDLQVMQ